MYFLATVTIVAEIAAIGDSYAAAAPRAKAPSRSAVAALPVADVLWLSEPADAAPDVLGEWVSESAPAAAAAAESSSSSAVLRRSSSSSSSSSASSETRAQAMDVIDEILGLESIDRIGRILNNLESNSPRVYAAVGELGTSAIGKHLSDLRMALIAQSEATPMSGESVYGLNYNNEMGSDTGVLTRIDGAIAPEDTRFGKYSFSGSRYRGFSTMDYLRGELLPVQQNHEFGVTYIAYRSIFMRFAQW
jgi:hypothetical protein